MIIQTLIPQALKISIPQRFSGEEILEGELNITGLGKHKVGYIMLAVRECD